MKILEESYNLPDESKIIYQWKKFSKDDQVQAIADAKPLRCEPGTIKDNKDFVIIDNKCNQGEITFGQKGKIINTEAIKAKVERQIKNPEGPTEIISVWDKYLWWKVQWDDGRVGWFTDSYMMHENFEAKKGEQSEVIVPGLGVRVKPRQYIIKVRNFDTGTGKMQDPPLEIRNGGILNIQGTIINSQMLENIVVDGHKDWGTFNWWKIQWDRWNNGVDGSEGWVDANAIKPVGTIPYNVGRTSADSPREKAFVVAYAKEYNTDGSNSLGDPYDNGGGEYLHCWGDNPECSNIGVWIQDFNSGKTALISKKDKANAFVVKDDIWSCYANTGDPNKQETRAPRIYGAPVAAETSVPDNDEMKIQKFEKFFIIYDDDNNGQCSSRDICDFSDISSSSPYKDAIIGLCGTKDGDERVISGNPDGTFHPDEKVNRAQFAKMVFLAAEAAGRKFDKNWNNTFRDVPEDKWCAEFVNKLAKEKVIEGYSDGTFRPGEPIKMEEMLKMTILPFFPEITPDKFDTIYDGYCKGKNKGDKWYCLYMAGAMEKNIKPILDKEFTFVKDNNVGQNATRAQTAKAIWDAYCAHKRTQGIVPTGCPAR